MSAGHYRIISNDKANRTLTRSRGTYFPMIQLNIINTEHTSHLVECAVACMTLRKGLIDVSPWRSGRMFADLCKYGQYLHITSMAINLGFELINSLCRYMG